MVPAPIERSQLRGHRQQIGKSAALTVGRSPALSQRCGRCGSERSAEFGSVNHLSAAPTRAREAAPIPVSSERRPTCSGRLGGAAAAGRRRQFLFSEIVVGRFRFGATMELGRSGRRDDDAAAAAPAAMVPAPIERSQLRGHRQQIGKSAALTVGRSPALSQRCGRCGSERSAEFGSVNHFRCPHARARIIGKQGDC